MFFVLHTKNRNKKMAQQRQLSRRDVQFNHRSLDSRTLTHPSNVYLASRRPLRIGIEWDRLVRVDMIRKTLYRLIGTTLDHSAKLDLKTSTFTFLYDGKHWTIAPHALEEVFLYNSEALETDIDKYDVFVDYLRNEQMLPDEAICITMIPREKFPTVLYQIHMFNKLKTALTSVIHRGSLDQIKLDQPIIPAVLPRVSRPVKHDGKTNETKESESDMKTYKTIEKILEQCYSEMSYKITKGDIIPIEEKPMIYIGFRATMELTPHPRWSTENDVQSALDRVQRNMQIMRWSFNYPPFLPFKNVGFRTPALSTRTTVRKDPQNGFTTIVRYFLRTLDNANVYIWPATGCQVRIIRKGETGQTCTTFMTSTINASVMHYMPTSYFCVRDYETDIMFLVARNANGVTPYMVLEMTTAPFDAQEIHERRAMWELNYKKYTIGELNFVVGSAAKEYMEDRGYSKRGPRKHEPPLVAFTKIKNPKSNIDPFRRFDFRSMLDKMTRVYNDNDECRKMARERVERLPQKELREFALRLEPGNQMFFCEMVEKRVLKSSFSWRFFPKMVVYQK